MAVAKLTASLFLKVDHSGVKRGTRTIGRPLSVISRGETKRRCLLRCSGVDGGNGKAMISPVEEENARFVAMMREAQPYFRVHQGSTFVVILSPEIVASS